MKYEKRLADDDFSKGPEPSKEICLLENQLLPIDFRGNIEALDKRNLEFVFNSNSIKRLSFEVKVKDTFLSNHHGMVIVSSKSFERREIHDEEGEDDEKSITSAVLMEKTEKICELQVEIPKVGDKDCFSSFMCNLKYLYKYLTSLSFD